MVKTGRNLSEGNAPMYRSYKSRFGFRILLNQTDVCYRYTNTTNVNENVNDNTLMAWLSHFDEIFTCLGIANRRVSYIIAHYII